MNDDGILSVNGGNETESGSCCVNDVESGNETCRKYQENTTKI
jgi:hypothetical protein